MPITDRSKLRKGGFAQVREALQKFEGDVVRAEFGQWGGQLFDDEGRPRPPREFLEIDNVNVRVLEVTEELSMPIEEWSFRINSSEAEGTIWDKFLESADNAKLLIPDDLVGKRIVWQKVTIIGSEPRFTTSNYVIAGVKAPVKPAPKIVAKVQTAKVQPAKALAEVEADTAEATEAESTDPMEVAAGIAMGKTEAQFRSAIALNPLFSNSPLLAMAKAGAITQALVNEGRLVIVTEGNKQIYKKPE